MVAPSVLVTGVIVFLARICDVSIGTVRTIATVQGRTVIAFGLAIFEITIWVLVAGTVINQIREQPVLVVFYACGYATGNVVAFWSNAGWPSALISSRCRHVRPDRQSPTICAARGSR
jgi:uncharacterized protein YebE (UPF0316 family)